MRFSKRKCSKNSELPSGFEPRTLEFTGRDGSQCATKSKAVFTNNELDRDFYAEKPYVKKYIKTNTKVWSLSWSHTQPHSPTKYCFVIP